MRSAFSVAFFVIAVVIAGSGQTTYKGLTPGKSTRSDVESVVGRPLKEVSKTLIQYSSAEAAVKVFVQYREGSAVVERLELVCLQTASDINACKSLFRESSTFGDPDARTSEEGSSKAVAYFGSPRFIRYVEDWKGNDIEQRISFMSSELYDAAVPSGCNYTIIGTWDSQILTGSLDLGRVRIAKVGESGIKGTYEKNNGSFSLTLNGQAEQNYLYGHTRYKGDWKDAAGSGTVVIEVHGDKQISASFKRTSAKDPRPGTPYDQRFGDNWWGRCSP